MSSILNIILNSQDGITLTTEGKYCDKNILITPQLEDKTVVSTTEQQIITASDGYAGLRTVTVSEAPEPVLQEKTVTENGEVTPDEGYDGLSKVTVDVPIPDGYIVPSGSLTIIDNGTFDVTDKANVIVEIADNPLPIEVATEDEMQSLLDTAEIGSIYKYVGEDTATYKNSALYIIEASEENE